jgi:hypothetical protein
MLSRVIDLYACLWTVGSTRSAVVWEMVPSCVFNGVVSMMEKKL